ncbi:unnamed protein product [Brassicogethes aeneus]|uniref:GDP-fucose protein O-fucosyltransferase 2 n=1 Tax=Brassicogethes aeneus TaxID=1431903 RepID=A0A9P0AX27_BRAAE|nr:unnamed protein product [Brassicogethes aeneus]
MFIFRCILFTNLILISFNGYKSEEYCYDKNSQCKDKKIRYLFYDVNPPEGFNLRRDVYMRMAVLAYKLHNLRPDNLNSFKLVLPPWSHLVHWDFSQFPEYIPWSYYFDLSSLKNFAPVIEMYDFFNEYKNKYSVIIEETYILQHFEDMFESGNFEDRMEVEKCTKDYKPLFFHYSNITSNNVKCLSFHGSSTNLIKLFNESTASTIYIDHAEVALHEMFGNKIYWEARRSMRFNKELVKIANDFRKDFLNSTDLSDLTTIPVDWRDEKPNRNAKGGPYLSVHMRRKDFVKSRPQETPSLKNVSEQIKKTLDKLKLDAVFISTDAPDKEYKTLVDLIGPKYKVFKYSGDKYVKEKFKDGGIAIIDQIICSHARYFIGTQESTFSFRIQEEREIMGFPVKTTFNSLCNNDGICRKPSQWKIVY